MYESHTEQYHILGNNSFSSTRRILKKFCVEVEGEVRTVQILKCVNPFFNEVWRNRKLFECRYDVDRGFKDSDILMLYEPWSCVVMVSQVSYIMRDFEGVKPMWAVIQLKDKLNMTKQLDETLPFEIIQDYFFSMGVLTEDVKNV